MAAADAKEEQLELFYSDPRHSLDSFHTCLTSFGDSYDTTLKQPDIDKKIGEISDWVEKQKQSADAKSKKELIQNVGKVVTATTSGVQKLASGDPVGGALEIVSSVAMFAGEMMGGPAGAAVGAVIGTLCSIIGAIFSASKPKQPSIVAQLADVVHKELVDFNKKLQDQKFNGLKRRVADQADQLRGMKPEEKLDDPDLWNDYAQFMGELSERFEAPLPFKYDKELTKDPDVSDCVKALMTYCQAYSCYMTLLVTAKGRFHDLGSAFRDEEAYADRKIRRQKEETKEKLEFLSDKRYLTFLGTLPCEGGKLTKIVAVSRNAEARHLVKMVTNQFGLPAMPDPRRVEAEASLVSTQTVPLQTLGFPNPPNLGVQFINGTKFPLKVVYTDVKNKRSTHVVQPKSSYEMKYPYLSMYVSLVRFWIWGYILIYLDGEVREDDEPQDANVTRLIEFSLGGNLLNIQEKTNSEFSRGQNTRDDKNYTKTKTIYWMTNRTHYLASAEVLKGSASRLVVQDFDPVSGLDPDPFVGVLPVGLPGSVIPRGSVHLEKA